MTHRPTVHVVGLGPGGSDLVTAGTSALVAAVPARRRFLRTTHHPAAPVVAGATSFDHHYESARTLAEVYAAIVEDLVRAAHEAAVGEDDEGGDTSGRPSGRSGGGPAGGPGSGDRVVAGSVLYAVPGSPVVAERTVELLLADDRVRTVVHPALSFLDLTWARLGVDPVEVGVRVVDGHRFATEAAGERGPLLVAQCDHPFVLSDVKLAVDEPPERVVVLQRLGLPDEAVVELAWEDLDREVVPDHLTSLWIPELARPVAAEVARFEALMARLRVADPWKAGQTHDTLKRYLLEEAHEVLEAIDAYDPDTGEGAEELCSELGDLLYQVVFHSAIGTEAGWFTLADVARSIHDKLVARHPHLDLTDDGGVPADGAVGAAAAGPTVEELVASWERAKRDEHGRDSAFDGIPAALPALARALKVGRKAEALGLVPAAPPDLAAAARRAEDHPDDPDALGDLLAAAVELGRRHGLDAEDALRRTTLSAESRYRTLEHRPDPSPPGPSAT